MTPLSTPIKANNAQIPATTPSPRLRSPRGTSPRTAVSPVWGIFRHAKTMLALATIATMIFMRPAKIESRSNLGTFMDPSSYGFPSVTDMHKNDYVDDDNYDSARDNEDLSESVDTDTTDYTIPSTSFLLSTIQNPTGEESQARSTSSESQSRSSSSLKSSYDSSKHPVLTKHSTTQVDVQFVVDVSEGVAVGPQSKFILDGLERSTHINVVGMTFLNPNVRHVQIQERSSEELVWLVDWGSMQRDCHRLRRTLEALERKSSEKLLLLDYSGSTRQTRCDFWDENVRLAKRSIVNNRHYDHTKKNIQPGQLADNSGTNKDIPVLRAPLVVRERFVESLKSNSRDQNPMKTSRTKDVCFFWKRGDYSHYGFWRRDISNFIENFGKSTNYTTLVDIAANDEDGMEIGNIQIKYVQSLLKCKIVVVAQRDEWEDHYRLYESLASGSMVVMDSMLSMPIGLKNKTNVMVYDDLKSLESIIRYFLKNSSKRKSVARRGMELAFGRYRPWHQIEQLLFGEPLTMVDRPYDPAPDKMDRPQLEYDEANEIAT